MQHVKIAKGYRFRIAGGPDREISALPDPPQVGLVPAWIPFIRPRLNVTEGDKVSIGSLLFHDKRNPEFRFLSPAGGTIRRIQFGPRRVIEAIVIDRDRQNEKRIAFEALAAGQLASIDRAKLVELILKGGLWWVFRQLPFRDLPDPAGVPPMIIVSLDTKEPFHPLPAVYLQDHYDLFAYGLRVLEKLSDRVVIFTDYRDRELLQTCGAWLTHTVAGDYPADDPGTLHYYIKRSPEENGAWYIPAQDVLLLALLLSRGQYPVERTISVAGSGAPFQKHVRARIGVPLAHLADPADIDKHVRFIVGGLMRGHTAAADSFMGLRENALTVVPQGGEAEFLALFKPGADKPSYSRTFASVVNRRPQVYDCNLHGGQRACIACMHCVNVCPVDIMPMMAYKAILAEEVEEYLAHGLLDCVECGLCSYVCPSKIELTQTLKAAKAAYAKEKLSLT